MARPKAATRVLWGSRPALFFRNSREVVRAPTTLELAELVEQESPDARALFEVFGFPYAHVADYTPARRKELLERTFRRYGITLRPRYDWRTELAEPLETVE